MVYVVLESGYRGVHSGSNCRNAGVFLMTVIVVVNAEITAVCTRWKWMIAVETATVFLMMMVNVVMLKLL